MAASGCVESRKSFADNYTVDEVLGRGSFSIVRRCSRKQTGEQFAVKIIPSRHLGERARDRLNREIRICGRLHHPNICRLVDTFREPNFYFLCFELVSGGELFDDIVQRTHYSETDAANCISQLLFAIRYYQGKGIIHRDIKPENLLLANRQPGANVKLTDFGLAVEVESDAPQWHGFAGTSAYLSPEVVKRVPYGKPVDMWACGVILYIILVGQPPFWSTNESKLYNQIRTGNYCVNCVHWQTLTSDARDLVDRMLTVDPQRRITSNEALQHPWIRARGDGTYDIDRGDALDGLRSFNARRRLKKAMVASLLVGQGSRRSTARAVGNSLTMTYDFTPEVEGTAVTETEDPTTDRGEIEANDSLRFRDRLQAICVVM